MNINNIIRAWKDENYRLSLSAAEQAMLPENPVGALELSDAQLGAVSGAEASTIGSILCTAKSICVCPDTYALCKPHVPTLPPTKKAA